MKKPSRMIVAGVTAACVSTLMTGCAALGPEPDFSSSRYHRGSGYGGSGGYYGSGSSYRGNSYYSSGRTYPVSQTYSSPERVTVREPRTEEQGWQDICTALGVQKLGEWMIGGGEGDFLSAVAVVITKAMRAESIDATLKEIYPDEEPFNLRLLRNVLCALADGDFELKSLPERTGKAELIAYLKSQDATAGTNAKIGIGLLDAIRLANKPARE